MTLILRTALQYAVDQALGGSLSPNISAAEVANRALFEITSSFPWKFLSRASRLLASRPKLTITGAAFATETITLASAFDDYEFVPGDFILVTANDSADATLGQFFIRERTNGNAIKLTEEDAVKLGAAGDITFTLDTARVALPTDFAEIVELEDSNSLTGHVEMVSAAELVSYRTQNIPRSTRITWGNLSYNTQGTFTAPVPVLEIWPIPSTAKADRFSLSYRAQVRTLLDDNSLIEVPDYMHGVVIDMITAVAKGYEGKRGVGMGMSDQIQIVLAGMSMKTARRRDGQQEGNTGKVTNTAYRKTGDQVSFVEGLVRSSDTIIGPR